MQQSQSQTTVQSWSLYNIWEKTKIIGDMVKLPHTVFALPMAYVAAILSVGVWPGFDKMILITLAMIGIRNGAMAFNRLADAQYDAKNPRTAGRAIPAGLVTPAQVMVFVVFCAVLFLVSAYFLNPLAFAISPLALAAVYSYSYAKRFTPYSHVFLGFCLGGAPIGAWVGVTGKLEALPIVLSLAITLWVAGFDILYSCQDMEFDRKAGLHSIPQRFGLAKALRISSVLHLFTFICLLIVMYMADLGLIFGIGLLVIGGLLIYEHILVKPDDLSRIKLAFCTVNGIISISLLVFTIADVFLF